MTATTSDIVMVYTGGSVNTDPSQSLGGNPSNQPVSGLANNLFKDITDAQSVSGLIDYRCFYKQRKYCFYRHRSTKTIGNSKCCFK